MAASTIGTVKSGSGKPFALLGINILMTSMLTELADNIGKAYTAREAMTKAEAWLYNK